MKTGKKSNGKTKGFNFEADEKDRRPQSGGEMDTLISKLTTLSYGQSVIQFLIFTLSDILFLSPCLTPHSYGPLVNFAPKPMQN